MYLCIEHQKKLYGAFRLGRSAMKKITARELFTYVRKQSNDVEIYGNYEVEICGFSSLQNYKQGSITWIKGQANVVSNMEMLTAVVCPPDIEIEAEVKLVTDNPKDIFFTAIAYLDDKEEPFGIAETAVLGNNVSVGRNVSIGAYCCIADNVIIGDDTKIEPHVVVHRNVRIGRRCTVKAGAVIGGEGFGYSKRDRTYHKVSHYGTVVVGDDVDIGNNTCIDRGTIDDTVIEDGVKIDNLCHIAHNARIGRASCIVANSTICGSVSIGREAYIAPNSVIMNQMQVEDGALLGMGAGVIGNVKKNTVNVGFPAKVIRTRTDEDWKKY